MDDSALRNKYTIAKRQCAADWMSVESGEAIRQLALFSLQFLLDECEPIDLVSQVPGKEYFSFKRTNVIARPVNKSLFVPNVKRISRLWKRWISGSIVVGDFAKLTYTIALAPCLAMEIFNRQNKKGPATFFECYIGHLFSKAAGVNPTKKVRLPILNRNVLMTMDFLFDMGEQHQKVHVPVKMSTRERVVQAWAHQRLLDTAYGEGSYRGVMILFSETKLDSRSLEVVEICVPDQWLAYQSLLAHMDRIYYFDVPVRYQALTNDYPNVIVIKPFRSFFDEIGAVLQS